MRLYKVTCRGMRGGLGSDVAWGIAYVVAPDPASAYEQVRQYLVDESLGFEHERELDTIKLIADSAEFPDCEFRLYLPEATDADS